MDEISFSNICQNHCADFVSEKITLGREYFTTQHTKKTPSWQRQEEWNELQTSSTKGIEKEQLWNMKMEETQWVPPAGCSTAAGFLHLQDKSRFLSILRCCRHAARSCEGQGLIVIWWAVGPWVEKTDVARLRECLRVMWQSALQFVGLDD